MSIEQLLQSNTQAAQALLVEIKAVRELLAASKAPAPVAPAPAAPAPVAPAPVAPAPVAPAPVAPAPVAPAPVAPAPVAPLTAANPWESANDAQRRAELYAQINAAIMSNIPTDDARKAFIATLQGSMGVATLDHLGTETIMAIAANIKARIDQWGNNAKGRAPKIDPLAAALGSQAPIPQVPPSAAPVVHAPTAATFEDVRALLVKVMTTTSQGQERVASIFAQVGAASITDIKPPVFAQVIALCNQALGGANG